MKYHRVTSRNLCLIAPSTSPHGSNHNKQRFHGREACDIVLEFQPPLSPEEEKADSDESYDFLCPAVVRLKKNSTTTAQQEEEDATCQLAEPGEKEEQHLLSYDMVSEGSRQRCQCSHHRL